MGYRPNTGIFPNICIKWHPTCIYQGSILHLLRNAQISKEEIKMTKKYSPLLIILAIFAMFAAFGCGNSSNPATPELAGANDLELAGDSEVSEGSSVWAILDVTFDPETNTMEAVEVRNAETHYDITPFVAPYCLFSGIYYDAATQYLEFDLEMMNPSAIDVWDVRVLMLADPTIGWELLNVDDYTKLFSPFPPSQVNPFIAYAESVPLREFGAGLIHIEKFEMRTPLVIPSPLGFRLLVECSHPSNCEDVYLIDNQTLSNPISDTVVGYMSVDVFDWQGNIGQVYVDTTPITGGLSWLGNTGGDTYEAGIFNSAGAAPGKYMCMITADSWSSPDNLYDFLEIEVIPGSTTSGGWDGTDYNINGGCGMDLGVIADPGGPRDSEILMAGNNIAACDAVIKYDPYYAANSLYVALDNYDPDNDDYQPYPIDRIDAADDGAFSFTNTNPDIFIGGAIWIYNFMVWTCFDNIPQAYMGPSPMESRYYFDLSYMDIQPRPADVCDDFELGQYALFTSTYTYAPEDLFLIGTMPGTYTHDLVKFKANMDTFAGIGDGLVDPDGILGIDTIEFHNDVDGVRLYVLESNGGLPQVEVFEIHDTKSGFDNDAISHIMTIDIDTTPLIDYGWIEMLGALDIEILPINNDYDLNPNDHTVCVLVDWYGSPYMNGEIFLYNAQTGAFLETVGDALNIALENTSPHHLDTDDGDWEIHVSHTDASGVNLVTVFDHS